MDDFERLKQTWTELGRIDPLWAILTSPEGWNNRWETDAFFASGRVEIQAVLDEIHFLPFTLKRRRALDFGCAVGRLTQALSRHFGRTHGVDIAPSMIDTANQLNRAGRPITYHLNQEQDLRLFASRTFDFIYSRIVLQHIPPPIAVRYLLEFVRILKPGGLMVFQLPAEPPPAANSGPHAAPYLRPSARFAADIEIAEATTDLQAGERRHLAVRLRNTGRVAWSGTASDHPVRVGNHWLNTDGSLLSLDDGRVDLPSVQPGESVLADLVVTAPATPGDYVLEVDAVVEQVAWFSDRGSPTARMPVRVVAADGTAPVSAQQTAPVDAPAPADEMDDGRPKFDLFGIAVPDVVRALEAAGGRVVALQHDRSVGRDWESYFYYVTKDRRSLWSWLPFRGSRRAV